MGKEKGYKLRKFMQYLAEIYPCNVCKQHILEFISKYEIPTSHKHFKKYLCILHNTVNKKLDKPLFNCNNI